MKGDAAGRRVGEAAGGRRRSHASGVPRGFRGPLRARGWGARIPKLPCAGNTTTRARGVGGYKKIWRGDSSHQYARAGGWGVSAPAGLGAGLRGAPLGGGRGALGGAGPRPSAPGGGWCAGPARARARPAAPSRSPGGGAAASTAGDRPAPRRRRAAPASPPPSAGAGRGGGRRGRKRWSRRIGSRLWRVTNERPRQQGGRTARDSEGSAGKRVAKHRLRRASPCPVPRRPP